MEQNFDNLSFPDDIFDWSHERLEEFLFPKSKPDSPDTPLKPDLVPPILVDFENFVTILKLGKLFQTCLKAKASKRTFFPKRLQRVRNIVETTPEFKPYLPWMLYISNCSKDTLLAKHLLTGDCHNCLYHKYEK